MLIDQILPWQTLPPVLIPLLIFSLRALNLTLATVSTLLLVRGYRIATFCMAFMQSFLFITVIQGVLQNLDTPLNAAAYAGGYATGILAGMALEARISPGYGLMRITSSLRGEAIIDALHEHGFGATIISGRGRDGTISSILCFLRRREIPSASEAVLDIDKDAFIVTENVRQVFGGYHI